MKHTTRENADLAVQVTAALLGLAAGGVVAASLSTVVAVQPTVLRRAWAQVGVFGITITVSHHTNKAAQRELGAIIDFIDS